MVSFNLLIQGPSSDKIDPKLSLTHGFFLSMGGFTIQFSGSKSRCLTLDDLHASEFQPIQTRSLAAISLAASPPNTDFTDFPLPHETGNPLSLNKVEPSSNENFGSSPDGPSGSSHLLRPHILSLFYRSRLANVAESEILDKSKTDPFSKGIAVCQILWFLIACIARPVIHLPVTQLEIMTLAFATLNVVMYLIWWRKPLNVECPITIHASNLSDHFQPDQAELERKLSLKDQIRRTVMNWDSETNACLEAGKLSDSYQYLALAMSAIMAMIFSAVHWVAWNSPFPTFVERMLWSCSAIITFTVPIIFAAVWAVSYNLVKVVKRRRSVLMWPKFVVDLLIFFHRHLLPFLSLLYVLARLFLLVLPFVFLRNLPPTSYCTISWTRFLPHFSS